MNKISGNNTYNVFFRNLANPLRVSIISELKKNESSVGDLSERLKVEKSKLSHALKSLKSCNIVDFKQEGKQRIYFLNKKTIIPMLELIDKHSKMFCSGNCKFCDKERK